MIPAMLIAGFVPVILPGRRALANDVGLGLVWAIVLLAHVVISGVEETTSTALLGLANAAVGAGVSQLLR